MINAVVAITAGIWVIQDHDHARLSTTPASWSTAIGIVVLYLWYGSERDQEFFLHGR